MKAFVEENRKSRMRFMERTEKLLDSCHNSELADSISKDRRREENLSSAEQNNSTSLDPARFTKFMGEFHDQNQEEVPLTSFKVPIALKEKVVASIKRAKKNKSPGIYGIHNEMIRLEPDLMAEMFIEMCKVVRRSREYPVSWSQGLITPIYKKGDAAQPQNYHSVYMLSRVRKILEAVITAQISKKLVVFERQYGFQSGLSTAITLMDVDAVVKRGEQHNSDIGSIQGG